MNQEDVARLEARLREWGATEEELDEARRTQSFGDLALDLVVRPPGPLVTFEEAAARAGIDAEEAARYWRALGFPDPLKSGRRLSPDALSVLGLIAVGARDVLGEDATLALARVMGGATWQVAQAVVDTFRVRFEAPQLAAGVPYAEVVETYVGVARELLPPFVDALGALFVRQLVAVAYGAWSADAEGVATSRDVAVGFADLVGWSTMSRTLSPAALVGVVDGFERVVAEVAGAHGGRVVKLIGDAAMFAADDALSACRLGLEVAERVTSSQHLPPVRVGVAAGAVVSRNGDLFGDVVNLAARLVAVADEGSVVADEAVRARVGDELRFEALPPRSLKGFGAEAVAYRVRR
ncbi:MAG TPA: adenylate/guanylate cyclase domain-containing protein [Acidimicrobiales bacterium]|nr:adenylate/guanylate cyclase domain-containing protein [Acidimicrobiales bacterium]